MKKLVVIIAIVLCFFLLVNAWWSKKKDYPSKPITIICPWSAGGGTDRTARFLSELLSKELGQPVNVVNKTGGDGAVGHSFGANAKPDGYAICNVTFELGSLKYLGYSDISPASFTPVSQFNDNAASVVLKLIHLTILLKNY
jgi:tripartite-type tricarboxylate transporter receptor subunit TctC